MDIALKFKRVVATVATAALFASTASVAIAQFIDVPVDAWYATYVEQLVDDGVIDSGDYYRPADALNRAELTKMAIEATGGLVAYTVPANPTFDDVPVDAWFYDYVEAAVQLDILSGYTDAQGNLTGMFGPGDNVNRAAATKILVNAFRVPTLSEPASSFPDVQEGAWYYEYVVTAYNQSILDGYDNGYFGPADEVTRAQVAKLVVLADTPVERETGIVTPPDGPVTSEGALELSLNDDTPPSSTLPQYASSINLLSFDLTAADDDVEVNQVIITRGGVGQTSDWDALYLYNGAERLTTGRTINSDTNTATFAISLLVEAGTTSSLTLVGDLINTAFAGVSNQHYFYVAEATNIASNAQSLTGDFPTIGNTFTIGSATTAVNGVTIVAGSAPTQPQIGEMDAEIATLKLTAGSTNDIALHQITLTQAGSLSTDKLLNCTLLRSTDEVATSAGFDGDRVTFVLDTPYIIPEGQSKTFYAHCDIDGGRTTDTITLYLDENTDLVVVDQQYGFGAVVTNTFGSGAANSLTLKGGQVTVVDNSPSATQLAQNTTNNQVLAFGMTTDRDLTVRDTYINIEITDPTNVGPDLSAAMTSATEAGTSTLTNVIVTAPQTGWEAGDMLQVPTASGTEYTMITNAAAEPTYVVNALTGIPTAGGTITELNPYDYVKNVRLVDIDTGSTLAGPLTTASAGILAPLTVPSHYYKVHSEDYELTGGDTRHLAVEVDLHQDIPANYRIRASVAYGDSLDVTGNSYLKDLAANEYVKAADVVGASTEVTALAGKWMTTAANSLTVAKSSTPTSYNYVKGDNAVPSLGFAMTSGDAGDITVKRLSVRVYADANNNFGDNAGVGAVAATGTLQDGVIATAAAVGTAGNSQSVQVISTAVVGATCAVTTPGAALVVTCDASAPTTTLAATIATDALFTATGGTATVAITAAAVPLAGGIDGVALANPYGDTAANTLAASVTLYDGDNDITPAIGLTLVGSPYVAGTSYYMAQFDDLNLTVEAGDTKSLVAKVTLLNTMSATAYLAVALDPAIMIAEDADANTITPISAGIINNLVAKDPLITIGTQGTLTVSSDGENSDILVAGDDDAPIAQYTFSALQEGFNVNKLTIVNDALADFGDAPVAATTVVESITIIYPDVDGYTQTKTKEMNSGITTFSALDFYVPVGEDAVLSVYANINSLLDAGGEIATGQTIRLGLQNIDNTITTFEAIGSSSSETDNFLNPGAGVPTTQISGIASLNPFVVRKAKPIVTKASSLDANASPAAIGNRLYGVTITADSGPISLGRMVFNVTDTLGGSQLDELRFYNGSEKLSGVVAKASIIEETVGDVSEGGAAVTAGGGTIIVALLEEVIINEGSEAHFYLDADITGGVPTVGSIITGLSSDDDAAAMLFARNGIFSTVTGTTGTLMPASTSFLADATTPTADFVWSDRSADIRAYTTFDGPPAVNTTIDISSLDWVNGYLLQLNNVASHSID